MAQGTKQTEEKNKVELESNEKTQTPPSRQAGSNQPQGLTRRSQQDRGLSRRDQFPFWSPFSFFDNFRTEMERLFDDFGFGQGSGLSTLGDFGRGTFNWSPQTEIFERGNELVVRADLPGLSKDDITVDLEDDRLTIRGERRDEREIDEEGYYQSERSYGSFYRSIPLPEGVDGEKAKADFNNGVLEITMPKPEQKQRGRRIEIGSGGSAKT